MWTGSIWGRERNNVGFRILPNVCRIRLEWNLAFCVIAVFRCNSLLGWASRQVVKISLLSDRSVKIENFIGYEFYWYWVRCTGIYEFESGSIKLLSIFDATRINFLFDVVSPITIWFGLTIVVSCGRPCDDWRTIIVVCDLRLQSNVMELWELLFEYAWYYWNYETFGAWSKIWSFIIWNLGSISRTWVTMEGKIHWKEKFIAGRLLNKACCSARGLTDGRVLSFSLMGIVKLLNRWTAERLQLPVTCWL